MVVYLGDKAVGLGFVVEKEVPKIKFGATVDTFLGEINGNGQLQAPTGEYDIVLDGVKSLSNNSLSYKFYLNTNIRNVYFPDLKSFNSSNCFYGTFYSSTIKRLYCPKLESAATTTACYLMCQNSTLEYFDFAALKSVSGVITFGGAFQNTKITSAYFYSLTSVQKQSWGYTGSGIGIFQGCSLLTEIHFRRDSQAVIEALQKYEDKWGAPNATIYFDLVGKITVDGVEYARKEVDTIRVDWERVWVAWESTSGNIIYTSASGEPAVGTAVYSDAGITQVGTVSGVA